MQTGPKDWFGVGARLIGLWLLVVAFDDLRAAFYIAAGWTHTGNALISLAGFVAQGVVGLALLFAGDAFASLLYGSRSGGYAATSNAVSQSAPPGWYADPTANGGLRYWDGRGWTAHTRPTSAV